MIDKINKAHHLLREVAQEMAENPKLDYRQMMWGELGYQTLCGIVDVQMDIRVLSEVSKSKVTKEERIKKYVR